MNVAVASPRRFRMAWSVIPIVILAVGAVLANTGVPLTPNAHAATSNVQVDATVASTVTLTPCGTPLALSVTMGGFNSATCNVTFGASNNAALPLTLADNAGAGQFFASNFVETGSACAAISTVADTVGYKVSSAGLTATKSTACTASAGGTNADYSPFPNAATTVCTTSALGNQVCPIAVGITEAGSNASAGTYSGQMNFAA